MGELRFLFLWGNNIFHQLMNGYLQCSASWMRASVLRLTSWKGLRQTSWTVLYASSAFLLRFVMIHPRSVRTSFMRSRIIALSPDFLSPIRYSREQVNSILIQLSYCTM